MRTLHRPIPCCRPLCAELTRSRGGCTWCLRPASRVLTFRPYSLRSLYWDILGIRGKIPWHGFFLSAGQGSYGIGVGKAGLCPPKAHSRRRLNSRSNPSPPIKAAAGSGTVWVSVNFAAVACPASGLGGLPEVASDLSTLKVEQEPATSVALECLVDVSAVAKPAEAVNNAIILVFIRASGKSV